MNAFCRFIATVFVVVMAGCDTRPLGLGDPNDLIKAISRAQKNYVREAQGEMAYQCFTEADYQTFFVSHRAQKIAEELKGDRKFMEAILGLNAKSATEQAQFIAECRRPLRLTWTQLGRISHEGQTDAGQRAELDIANAIADMILELCRLSETDLYRVFKTN